MLKDIQKPMARSQERVRRELKFAKLVQGDRKEVLEMICKITTMPVRNLEEGLYLVVS